MTIHLRARQILRFSRAFDGSSDNDNDNDSDSDSDSDSDNAKKGNNKTPAVAAALAKLSRRDLKLAQAVVDLQGGSIGIGVEKEDKWPAKWEDEAPGVSAKSISMVLMHWRQACSDAGVVVPVESEAGSEKDEEGRDESDEWEDDRRKMMMMMSKKKKKKKNDMDGERKRNPTATTQSSCPPFILVISHSAAIY